MLPPSIQAAIERSRRIVELNDDWDSEGSPGYVQATLDITIEVLESIVEGILTSLRVSITTVDVQPGPDGSIDVEFVVGDRRLLLNVPGDSNDAVLYYGHGPDRRDPIEGEFVRTNHPRFLTEWLVT